MIRTTTSKEFRARLDAIYRSLLKSWLEANPLPRLPMARRVAEEIVEGKARILSLPHLEQALKWIEARTGEQGEFGNENVFDCISTPTLDRIRALVDKRTAALERFKQELAKERDDLLDRVLFDGDAPYPLLQAFRKWKDSKARKEEPFDGP
jgi:hypothetical protein